MKTRFDAAVFIGRFQPFHIGHLAVAERALAIAERVIIVVGSNGHPTTTRYPFRPEAVETYVRAALAEAFGDDAARVTIRHQPDVLYNDQTWIRSVQALVHAEVGLDARITLIGHHKDASSYYLRLFPTWGTEGIDNVDGINATDVRAHYFLGEDDAWRDRVPGAVASYLDAHRDDPDFVRIRDELEFVTAYRRQWDAAPYPPTFVTVDAVVVQSGHVLLVTRGAMPGKGQLALPGGFVGEDERLLDGCLRELREETRLKVPEPVLRGSLKGSAVFDAPHRSARGRTITHAYHFELRASEQLPAVKGSDDAARARWIPLGRLAELPLFEDHHSIVRYFVG